MYRSFRWMRYALPMGALWILLAAVPAIAAELPPYELDPVLSLTGDCSTSTFDPVPDPSCPYPALPGGPTSRFEEARALAIDKYGNEYVTSFAEGSEENGRVDIFDDEGKFISEAKVPFAQTIAVDSKGNLYVFENTGNVVRYSPSKYEPEAGIIEYANPAVTVSTGSFVGSVAIDGAPGHLDQVLVARDAITRFSSADAGNEVLESFEPEGMGSWPEEMAVDSQRRRIYVSYCKNEAIECGVMVVGADAPHVVLEEIDGSTTPAGKFGTSTGLLSIAIDEESGDFFVADPLAKRVYQFGEDYGYLTQLAFNELRGGIQIAVSNATKSLSEPPCEYPEEAALSPGDACNRHYLFVPVFKSAGRAVAFHPPDQIPPVIEAVSTGEIGETEAELRVTIDPGGLDTQYHFEITTNDAFEDAGFEGAEIFGAGTLMAKELATEASVFATGLVPGQAYRFKAVAENAIGRAPEEGQNEAAFTTYDDGSLSACPNAALRVGLSSQLPDCRAYELVTPADTSGRPPRGIGFPAIGSFTTIHSSPSGEAVSFKIGGGSLPGSSGVGSFEGDPYVSRRGDAGWSTQLVGPSGGEARVSVPASTSLDQSYSFWTARVEGPLVLDGGETQYIRYPAGHSELVGRGSLGIDPRAQGLLISENARHIIFVTASVAPAVAIQLEPNAPPTGSGAIYDRTIDSITGEEVTHVVSLLPGNVTPAAGETPVPQGISRDGEGIAFMIGNTLYLRVNNEATYEIGKGVEFAGVSEGGARIFYMEGSDLLAFDVASGEVIDFSTTGDVIPVNVATAGTRAYFVSPSVLGSANPEGDLAQAGKQNLYLSEEGAISFVATVTNRDVEGEAPPVAGDKHDGLGLWTDVLGGEVAKDPSRTNPDGTVFLFQSRAEITGYPLSEFAQIYRYDGNAGRLDCISCIPTGTPSTGGASLETYAFDSLDPPPFSPYGLVPNLTPNGKRIFFESTEPLVSTDTDNVRDVYEWEANEVGSCTRPEGCVYLISSGQSERDNFLYAHSVSGDDVFFTTTDALTSRDTGGTTSIYDARVGGGFHEPTEGDPCIGEGCQATPLGAIPQLAIPTTSALGRSGTHAGKRCPKGKRRVKKNAKVRCVRKKHLKAKRRPGTTMGMAR